MTAEVVRLRACSAEAKPEWPEPAPAVVWQCNCGCEHFWLHEDGRIECPDCKTWQDANVDTGRWLICEPPGAA